MARYFSPMPTFNQHISFNARIHSLGLSYRKGAEFCDDVQSTALKLPCRDPPNQLCVYAYCVPNIST